jgi:hypothetical protein
MVTLALDSVLSESAHASPWKDHNGILVVSELPLVPHLLDRERLLLVLLSMTQRVSPDRILFFWYRESLWGVDGLKWR